MTSLLRGEGLSFSFPERPGAPLFSGLDIELEEGESLGLTGPNGSGKSTLLRVLASLLRPSEGRVLYRGAPLTESLAAYRSVINYSAGAPLGFYPRLTGIDNLRFFSGLKGRVLDPEEAGGLVARVGLPAEAGEKRYAQYSLGMKQRLHLARLLLEPCELILLDEPSNGLDAEGLKTLEALLNGPLKEKAKVVISHDADFLAAVTRRRVRIGP